MKTTQFWAIIESAWALVPGSDKNHPLLVSSSASDRRKGAAWTDDNLITFYDKLRDQLKALAGDGTDAHAGKKQAAKKELKDFGRITYEYIEKLDKDSVAAHSSALNGGDDGWLYYRAWIVAAGKGYYDLVRQTPSKTAKCFCLWGEDMLSPAMDVYEELYEKEMYEDE